MEFDLTFKSVCDYLKKEGADDSKILEAVDTMLGLTIVCAPIALGPAGLALLPLLRVKNELTKIGKGVFLAVTKHKGDNYLARLERMKVAHGLLVYTAFFETLDKAIPNDLRKKVDLQAEERRMLADVKNRTDSCDTKPATQPEEAPKSNPLAEVPIVFPHPTQTLQQQIELHAELWKQLSEGFSRFVQMLAVWDEMDEGERKSLRKTLDGVPELAGQTFIAQYVELSRKFHDFAIWANLHQHEATREAVSKLAGDVSNYIALAEHSYEAVDLGLTKLYDTITDLPDEISKRDATGILDGLLRHYKARLNDPIIEDKEGQTGDGPNLRFPKVRAAFVPQAFRVIRPTGQKLHLEDEDTWKELPSRDDLGPFLLSYLLSPYSADAPLLVLGHPGSGKSLLTKVLAAQLAARNHSVVRVPLREVRADVGVVAQIEDAIGQITKQTVDSWAKLSAAFKDHPPVVILDGYDELLQASGRVFAGYLREVKAFQKSEAEQGRPVRVIVTSRVTLIDKATLPVGSTVVHLLEFDDRRQDEWISVWNTTNVGYFKDAEINPFCLPAKNQDGAEKILELAGQPLLLLMLALYDSQDNQLRECVALDRTRLYDELLRRFVKREREKDQSFCDNLTEKEQQDEIEKDMQRLGVAAIGMYNRRKVVILAEELEADLKFFNLLKEVTISEGLPMTQADLLLGSFFFVHKSQAKTGTDDGEATDAETSAFEFLHNTLGEFLTADFILRWAINEVQALAALKGQDALLHLFHGKLNSHDTLERQWYASLVYTPLFTRPVILDMIREWSGHLLNGLGMTREEFADHLDMVLNNQIDRLINKRAMPSIMRKEVIEEKFRAEFGEHPLIGHIAVYSLNLVLLRAIVCEKPSLMDESAFKSYKDGARPWDRLVHIWRSWFSLEALSGLTAVIESAREGNIVKVKAKPTFQVTEARGRLDVLLNVAVAVADDLTAGVCGLALCDLSSPPLLDTTEIARRLASEQIEATFQIAIRELQQAARSTEDGIVELVRRAEKAMEIALQEQHRDEVERVAMLFASGVRNCVACQGSTGDYSRGKADWELPHPNLNEDLDRYKSARFISHILERSPEAALEWVRAIKLLMGGWLIRGRDAEEFADRFLHGGPPVWELLRESPLSAITWVNLMRELGVSFWWRRGPQKGFERFFHPGMIVELVDRSPESAVIFLEAIQELGGDSERFWRHMEPEIVERLLNPNFIINLAERSPHCASPLIRLLRRWSDGRLTRKAEPDKEREIVGQLLNVIRETSFLRDLAARSAETTLELVQLVRALGGEDVLSVEYRSGMLEQLSSQHLFDPSEQSPKDVVAMIQLLRELGEDSERVWRRLDSKILNRILDPRYLFEMTEHSPHAIMSLSQLLRERGARRVMQEMDPEIAHRAVEEFIERVVETPYLFDLLNRSPESALELMRTVRMIGEWITGRGVMGKGMLKRLLDPRVLLHLSMRSPEGAVLFVQLLRELGNEPEQPWHHLESDSLRRFLDPNYLLELSARAPKAASSLVRLLREWGNPRTVRKIDPEQPFRISRDLVERFAMTPLLLDLVDRSLDTGLELIMLIRAWGGQEALSDLVHSRMMSRLVGRNSFTETPERSPSNELAMMLFLWEAGENSTHLLQHMDPSVIERILDPRYLLELTELMPETAKSLHRLLRASVFMQALREVDGERVHNIFRRFIEFSVATPFLIELADRSPEVTLEIVRAVRSLGIQELWRGLMDPRMLETISEGRILIRLSERSPEIAALMAQILWELGRDFPPILHRLESDVGELLDPIRLLRLSERNPDTALKLVEICGEVASGNSNGKRRGHGPRLCGWHPSHVESVIDGWLNQPTRDPRGFAAALILAHQLRSPETLFRLAEAVSVALDQDSLLAYLPIGSLVDLKWLANTDEARELKDTILNGLP